MAIGGYRLGLLAGHMHFSQSLGGPGGGGLPVSKVSGRPQTQNHVFYKGSEAWPGGALRSGNGVGAAGGEVREGQKLNAAPIAYSLGTPRGSCRIL